MPKKISSLALASDLSALAGFVTFFIFGGSNHLWLLPFALFLLSFLKRPKQKTYLDER
ncbi:MAG: hypothetical protein IH584_01770, partial [Candidatus Aminicenantes bacterium]|nr:hypothetical protein [Candidatus Aminicenantes bacterium]